MLTRPMNRRDPGGATPLAARHQARRWANLLNLSTPLGLALATVGQATLNPWRNGLVVATGHRLPFPSAAAFTVGKVVLLRMGHEELLLRDPTHPGLMLHEERHSSQYALCLGPALIPLYAAACIWSWARTGDWWSGNIFETRAGLADGGYVRSSQHHSRSGLLAL